MDEQTRWPSPAHRMDGPRGRTWRSSCRGRRGIALGPAKPECVPCRASGYRSAPSPRQIDGSHWMMLSIETSLC